MTGLFDYDFCTATRVKYPSLLLMKMANYLLESGEDYRMLKSVEPNNRYDKVMFFSDKNITEIPSQYYLIENLEFYGEGFNTEVPEMVHYAIPDISVYNDLIREKLVDDDVSAKKALTFLDSAYYLAKYNNQTLPVPPIAKQKKIFLYDKDFLAYKDCWEILDKILQKNPTSIYSVWPLKCHTASQFFYLREEYEKVSRQNDIILDYYVPDKDFDVYFGKYKLRLLGEITKTSNVSVYIGKNYVVDFYGKDFYLQNLLYSMNLIFSYYSRNIPILAEVWEQLGADNPYLDFYKSLRSWTNSRNYDITLRESFSKHKKTKERLENFLQLNPIFEEFFDKTKNDLIQTRGIW